MTSPFEPPPFALSASPSSLPVAVVVDDKTQFDAYLAAGRTSAESVMVVTVADVPERLGGMAVVTERDLGDELRGALLRALGA